jgi:site-specific recombinase XerD
MMPGSLIKAQESSILSADDHSFSSASTRAARVMARKSPATQVTYLGIYNRFGRWLAARDGAAESDVRAFGVDALIGYLDELEARAAPATVKKERAALRVLARYLHQLRVIDATEILMVEIPTVDDRLAVPRQGLDAETWGRVVAVATARLTPTARQRTSPAAAARDLALVQVLGGAGLRSAEARGLPVDPFTGGRSDNQGGTVYLRVQGKRHKVRVVPLFSDVVDALDRWRGVREQIPELANDELLFPRLGRQLRDGRLPDAGGPMTRQALLEVVRPIMLAAGVGAEQAHPHTLRHTFGRQYMAAPGAELSRLQRIMGHASPETTSRYVHHDVDELGAEHRRIERLRSDPLARRQHRRRQPQS